jgi:hypothetical protein
MRATVFAVSLISTLVEQRSRISWIRQLVLTKRIFHVPFGCLFGPSKQHYCIFFQVPVFWLLPVIWHSAKNLLFLHRLPERLCTSSALSFLSSPSSLPSPHWQRRTPEIRSRSGTRVGGGEGRRRGGRGRRRRRSWLRGGPCSAGPALAAWWRATTGRLRSPGGRGCGGRASRWSYTRTRRAATARSRPPSSSSARTATG